MVSFGQPIAFGPNDDRKKVATMCHDDVRRMLDKLRRSLSQEVARQYGIAQRVLRRWKQVLAAPAPAFVTIQVTDVDGAPCAPSIAEEAAS